jgi:RNA polymerase sigma factor (sigma-70 family)
MATGQPENVLRQVRRAVLLRDGGGMTDGQLLDRFVSRRDEAEAAFTALVRRHGPMVLGVCRRILHNVQDAEDAFQATFLVLVGKAATIARPELLGNWLYGVAYRTALDARAAARRRRERQVDSMPEPEARGDKDDWRELWPILDRELNRLPDKYRLAVVLCDLESRTRSDVAGQLGVPVGTLSGRLTTARRLLAKRLTRHGVSLSIASLASALSGGEALASVSAGLVSLTVSTASAIALGQVTATAASANAARLAKGVLKVMHPKKLKLALAILVAFGILAGAGLVMVPNKEDVRPAGVTRVLNLGAGQRGRRVAWSPDGKTLVVVTKLEKTIMGIQYNRKGSSIQLWDFETGETQVLAEDKEAGLAFQHVRFSEDGSSIIATATEAFRPSPTTIQIHDVIKVWDAKTKALKRTVWANGNLYGLALSPDGKRAAGRDPATNSIEVWNIETGTLVQTLKSGKVTPPSVAFMRDGKSLLVWTPGADSPGGVNQWDCATGKSKEILKQARIFAPVAFSADGTLLACNAGDGSVKVWDIEKRETIASLIGNPSGFRDLAFAPDGKTLAVAGPDGQVRLWTLPSGELQETLKGHRAEVYAVAFAPDGKTLASASQDLTVRLWPMSK